MWKVIAWASMVFSLQTPPPEPRLEGPIQVPVSTEIYFGSIEDADVWADGRMVVLDGVTQEIHILLPHGEHLISRGGRGEGPEEFEGAFDLEIGPSGDLLVVDGRNRRITEWSREGEFLGTTPLHDLLPGGAMWPVDFSSSEVGTFLKTISFVPDHPSQVFLLPPGLGQRAEMTVEFVEGSEEAMTCNFCPMVVDNLGRIFGAVGDTVYGITWLGQDGEARETWSRSDLPAVPRTDAELQRLNDAARGRRGAEGGEGEPAISPFLPRFSKGSLAVDHAGRLWALPSQMEGQGTELDVFDDSGALLASVWVAEDLKGIRIRNGFLLGISESDLGEPVLFRYRITG